MANNKLLVEERSRDLGNFLVGRLLPFRKKRMVGPFCFIDHMGPSTFTKDENFDVDQHPHIGLCTLTYMYEGEIMHVDSTGAKQRITPGSVNLMVSGKGVSHSERTPNDLRDSADEHTMHGYQVWIALPVDQEEREPSFHHVKYEDLPRWNENGLDFILVAGLGFGKESPVPVFSNLFMLDIRSSKKTCFDVRQNLKGEIAVVVVKGKVKLGETIVEAGQMLISKTENECKIDLKEDTYILLFGGQVFPEERFMYWNFVSSSKARLEQAKQDWKDKNFPMIKGDNTYIPLP
jgi:redox-sensitive bicupin YhaK (pirin superfamily)